MFCRFKLSWKAIDDPFLQIKNNQECCVCSAVPLHVNRVIHIWESYKQHHKSNRHINYIIVLKNNELIKEVTLHTSYYIYLYIYTHISILPWAAIEVRKWKAVYEALLVNFMGLYFCVTRFGPLQPLSIGFGCDAQIISSWYQSCKFDHVWSQMATRAPHHPIYVVHVYGLKIHHTCGGVWECGVLSHIGENGPCKWVYKDLRLSNYCQLILVVTLRLIHHSIRAAGLPTCETK
jgi:hypothetical protein